MVIVKRCLEILVSRKNGLLEVGVNLTCSFRWPTPHQQCLSVRKKKNEYLKNGIYKQWHTFSKQVIGLDISVDGFGREAGGWGCVAISMVSLHKHLRKTSTGQTRSIKEFNLAAQVKFRAFIDLVCACIRFRYMFWFFIEYVQMAHGEAGNDDSSTSPPPQRKRQITGS